MAQALHNWDLTAVWVPDEEQEAIPDLTRARADRQRVIDLGKGKQKKFRQRNHPWERAR